MYTQNKRNFRFSSNRPHGGGGGFGRPKNYSNYRQPGAFRIKSLPNDPALFIRKATAGLSDVSYAPENSFDSFELVTPLRKNIERKGYIDPTLIQDQSIRPILEGRDLIGLASTGSGKTAAFLIPVVQKLFKDKNQGALIIAPTRELALQIRDEFRTFSEGMNIYSTLVIGGANTQRQIQELRRSPQVIIATPGRLKDLVQRRAIYLEDYQTIILDEVDMMVDIGFINDIKFFISQLPKVRQSLFFSATISPKVSEVLQSFVQNPVTVSVKKQDTSESVEQDVVRVTDQSKKVDVLHDLLIQDGFEKVMVFGRTKHGMDKLHQLLVDRGFKAGAIHGNKSQGNRQRTLQSFKSGELQILIATDVASRGLDISGVTHVINYDLPETYEDYIHRIGRTGRAGKTGIALTFIS